MKKIKITETQLHSVINKLINEQFEGENLADATQLPDDSAEQAPEPIENKIKSAFINKTIKLTTVPKGSSFGTYLVKDIKMEPKAIVLYISDVNRKNSTYELYYDMNGAQSDLFLKNQMSNTGKLVTNNSIISYLNKLFANKR